MISIGVYFLKLSNGIILPKIVDIRITIINKNTTFGLYNIALYPILYSFFKRIFISLTDTPTNMVDKKYTIPLKHIILPQYIFNNSLKLVPSDDNMPICFICPRIEIPIKLISNIIEKIKKITLMYKKNVLVNIVKFKIK